MRIRRGYGNPHGFHGDAKLTVLSRMGVLGVVFPGQGTQRPGLGSFIVANSAGARAVVERAKELTGTDYVQLYANTDPAELNSTLNAQPALYVIGAAALELLKDVSSDEAACFAGHSVGELTALYAAGVWSFEAGLQAVSTRAKIMAEHACPGQMLAVLGLEVDALNDVCSQVSSADAVAIAVHNTDTNLVCSGSAQVIKSLGDALSDRKGVRTVRLRTSHPFHSSLMSGAAPAWADYLSGVHFQPPHTPIVLNVNGRIARDSNEIRDGVIAQVDQPVLWGECVREMCTLGVDLIVEAGESRTLTAFNRAIEPSVAAMTLGDPASLRRIVRRLRGA